MPDSLRGELAEVVGEIVTDNGVERIRSLPGPLLVVGDVCALTLHRAGIRPKLAVVDFKTRRGEEGGWRTELSQLGDRVVRVENPQATITRGLWEAVRDAVESPGSVRIEVDGEEDLASLACIHHAPLGATVIYGIPNVGMMTLTVTDEIKGRVASVLEKMEA